jgi:hypothetical protein
MGPRWKEKDGASSAKLTQGAGASCSSRNPNFLFRTTTSRRSGGAKKSMAQKAAKTVTFLHAQRIAQPEPNTLPPWCGSSARSAGAPPGPARADPISLGIMSASFIDEPGAGLAGGAVMGSASFIDDPGPFGTLEEWQAYLEKVRALPDDNPAKAGGIRLAEDMIRQRETAEAKEAAKQR